MMRFRLPFGLSFGRRGLTGARSSDASSTASSPAPSSRDGGFVEPVAQRKTPGQVAGCGAAFFGVFLLAGLGFLAFFLIPAVHVVQAYDWQAVPCEIVSSSVASHPGDDGATYSVEVVYRYRVGGRDYTSDRYRFLGGSSSGSEGKQAVVDSLPPGTKTTCWVDPDDPSEAVLDRGFTWEYLLALLPLVFVAVGAGGIFFSLRKARKLSATGGSEAPRWMPDELGDQVRSARRRGKVDRFGNVSGGSAGFETSSFGFDEPPGASAVLEPSVSPLGRLAVIIGLALFWNGIVSVFVWQLWKTWKAGSPDGCLALFLVPFVLVGLCLLLAIPYQFLALFNPRPRVVLTPGRLTLGGSADLSWSFIGATGRISRLEIELEGREEADYTRGTDRVTAKEVFATIPLVDVALRSSIASGSTRIEVPAGTMHSFDADDNRIVWVLKLKGTIRRWPDVNEQLPVVIAPPSPGERPDPA